jgi:hypothetical protein
LRSIAFPRARGSGGGRLEIGFHPRGEAIAPYSPGVDPDGVCVDAAINDLGGHRSRNDAQDEKAGSDKQRPMRRTGQAVRADAHFRDSLVGTIADGLFLRSRSISLFSLIRTNVERTGYYIFIEWQMPAGTGF